MDEQVKKYRMETFGLTIKKFRLERNYTQDELAEKSGIEIRTLQRIEKGLSNVTLNNIYLLSDALKVHPSKLL